MNVKSKRDTLQTEPKKIYPQSINHIKQNPPIISKAPYSHNPNPPLPCPAL